MARAEDVEMPTRDELVQRIMGNDLCLRDKALIATLYLTGARVQEIVQNYPFIEYRSRSYKDKNGMDWYYWISKSRDRDWRGLTLGQIEEVEIDGKRIVLFKDVPIEKRRDVKGILRRIIPVDYDREKEFVDIIDRYCQHLIQDKSTALFPTSRQNAWHIIKRFHPTWWCHLMRHWRLTDLAVKKNMTDIELKTFTGWKDTRPAAVYVHMQWEDLARKMIR